MLPNLYVHTKTVLLAYFLFIFEYGSGADSIYRVRLGRSTNCNGFGICAIDNKISNEPDYEAVTTHIMVAKDGKLSFLFLKSTIQDKTFLKYFSTGYFVLESDYILPVEVCRTLDFKNKTLKAGKYRIVQTSDSYVVDF